MKINLNELGITLGPNETVLSMDARNHLKD